MPDPRRYDQGFFPDDLEPLNEDGLLGTGGVLTPEVLLEAYAKGIFPWTGAEPIPWFSPDPRLVLAPEDFRLSRSLRTRLRRREFDVRFDHDFPAVMRACATTPRPGQDGTWITPNMHVAYGELFVRGEAHCVEVLQQGKRVGGLYGISLGRAFFGESMFHRVADASKVALWALCSGLEARDFHFVDCQQETPHLTSLGARPISRATFLRRLRAALKHPTLAHSWADWADSLPWPR